jgi:uncharacterized protein YjbJ (UPF0337 family)
LQAYLLLYVQGSLKEVRELNWDQISGHRKQMKGKIKEKWGDLTDDEIDVAAGERDQLAGKIQQKYGVGKKRRRDRLMSGQKICRKDNYPAILIAALVQPSSLTKIAVLI